MKAKMPDELSFSPSLMSFLNSQGFLVGEDKTVTSKDIRKMFPSLIWYIAELEKHAMNLNMKIKQLEAKK